jgi:biotin synthase-like enzyme
LDGYKGEINRVFIGSWNGLDVDQDTLKACVQYVNKRLNLKRIAIYANTRSILSKTWRELRALRESWLSCIYRWAETWSDGVLQYVNKGCTFKEMLTAWEMINDANMDLSVMLMPGLGGLRYSEEHVKWIIKLLNSVRFKFITLMAINPPKESKYERIMSKEIVEWTNRPLTNVEIVEQIREIVKNTYTNWQKIWMFGKEIDIVWSNPINFSVQLYDEGKREILRTCDKYIKENKIPSKHIER